MPKTGRPRLEFDEDTVTGLARIGATYEEIAVFLQCHVDTIYNRMGERGEFFEAYQKGRAQRRVSLRRKQTELAMAGNVTMLIWLGKNELDQTDRQDVRTIDLTTLSDEQLERIVAGEDPTHVALTVR